jgi:formiminotetrahydrofolate cyclodeaminase
VKQLPSIEAFAERVGPGRGRPSAGAVAGLAVALATDLAAQVARQSEAWDERGGALAQAAAIRGRALHLAGELAEVYAELLDALVAALANPDAARPGPDRELGAQLAFAADLLLRVAEAASDAAELAVVCAESGDATVRADAVGASVLAAAAAEIAVHLVEVNLVTARDDPRLASVRMLARRAAASRSSALELPR